MDSGRKGRRKDGVEKVRKRGTEIGETGGEEGERGNQKKGRKGDGESKDLGGGC